MTQPTAIVSVHRLDIEFYTDTDGFVYAKIGSKRSKPCQSIELALAEMIRQLYVDHTFQIKYIADPQFAKEGSDEHHKPA